MGGARWQSDAPMRPSGVPRAALVGGVAVHRPGSNSSRSSRRASPGRARSSIESLRSRIGHRLRKRHRFQPRIRRRRMIRQMDRDRLGLAGCRSPESPRATSRPTPPGDSGEADLHATALERIEYRRERSALTTRPRRGSAGRSSVPANASSGTLAEPGSRPVNRCRRRAATRGRRPPDRPAPAGRDL
jgi:hypothetical protein